LEPGSREVHLVTKLRKELVFKRKRRTKKRMKWKGLVIDSI